MSLIYTSPTSRNNLYLGGKVDAKSLPTLKRRNVLRILNVTPAKEAGITAGVPNYFENTSGSKIKYKRVSVYDASTSDLLSFADEIVQFISNGLHHGSVLVHCQRGVSRSTTSVIMFLMRKTNMTLKQSLKLCQRRRPVADPIPAFLDQLETYETECRSWGHLTSVDETDQKTTDGKKVTVGDSAGKQVSEQDGRIRDKTTTSVGGEKRKAENIADDNEKRKRAVGPIGPSRGPVESAAIGPARGPAKSAAIGPARGPAKSAAAIGPAMGPSALKLSTEKAENKSGNDCGHKSKGVHRKSA